MKKVEKAVQKSTDPDPYPCENRFTSTRKQDALFFVLNKDYLRQILSAEALVFELLVVLHEDLGHVAVVKLVPLRALSKHQREFKWKIKKSSFIYLFSSDDILRVAPDIRPFFISGIRLEKK